LVGRATSRGTVGGTWWLVSRAAYWLVGRAAYRLGRTARADTTSYSWSVSRTSNSYSWSVTWSANWEANWHRILRNILWRNFLWRFLWRNVNDNVLYRRKINWKGVRWVLLILRWRNNLVGLYWREELVGSLNGSWLGCLIVLGLLGDFLSRDDYLGRLLPEASWIHYLWWSLRSSVLSANSI